MQHNEQKSEPEETVQPEADATVDGEKIEGATAAAEEPAVAENSTDPQD